MPLRCELFAGDAKLELAATQDHFHILPGARGSHVEKIQLALMLLDGAAIGPQELSTHTYGSATTAAVLRYKQRRNIINRNYQAAADNIVGKMTVAALDREMSERSLVRRWCRCTYQPTRQVYANKPHFFALVSSEAGPLNAGGPAPSLRPTLELALAAVPDALLMRNKAKSALDEMINGDNTPLSVLCTEALARHYKVTAPTDVIRVARDVRNALAGVVGRLLSARAWLRQGAEPGFAQTPTPRDGHSYVMRDYAVAGKLMRPTILIHEAFHDLSDFNQDFGGNPASDQGAAYHRNPTNIQLTNAYAMSQFVLHIGEGRERFLNDTD